MKNSVYTIFTDAELETYIFQTNKDAVVTFTTRWSSESQFIDHHNTRLIKVFPTLLFVKVDAESDPKAFNRFNLSKIPTTLFIRSGNVVDSIAGCPPFMSYQKKIEQVFNPIKTSIINPLDTDGGWMNPTDRPTKDLYQK